MEATQSAELIKSQIFYNYIGGIGLFLAGIGGLKVLFEWAIVYSDRYNRGKLERELKAKYPPEENGKSFQLIESSTKRGKIYLLDNDTDVKHHIASYATFQDLGYDYDMVKQMDKNKFDSIETGKIFLTQGVKFS